ncbi:VOC family protein [Natrinema salifodinae]|uniref:Catechol 2,3-dioxygenase n=1 Tax=Natrinema salifodinae TaxID=1202768 RepID=A0A1I0NP21_9EURY|nr:VOC family protein [Natrinema salifodinae]SEW03124.1 catechol 2,3-dioxygenase [Natrinema salifodinae]
MDRAPDLPDDTRIGRTALRVADRARLTEFYRDVVGLRVVSRDETEVVLGVDETPLLVLLDEPTAEPRDERAAGLYHAAFRVPSREALGAALGRIRDRWTLDGASDHGISEALYCTDPEGNGVEIYRDKPRDVWPRADDGSIRATGGPLDLDDLTTATAAADGDSAASEDGTVPAGTTVGHVHLEVTSLETARECYADALGFDVTMSYAPGARFFAAGDYHHHVGTNVWNRRSEPADDRARGLAWFELLVPDARAIDGIRERLADRDGGATVDERTDGGGIEVTDPDGIEIRIRPMG